VATVREVLYLTLSAGSRAGGWRGASPGPGRYAPTPAAADGSQPSSGTASATRPADVEGGACRRRAGSHWPWCCCPGRRAVTAWSEAGRCVGRRRSCSATQAPLRRFCAMYALPCGCKFCRLPGGSMLYDGGAASCHSQAPVTISPPSHVRSFGRQVVTPLLSTEELA